MKAIEKVKSTIILIVTAVFAVLLGVSVSLATPGGGADALTTANISAAVKAGGGEELWDSTASRFNKTVLDDLMTKLFDGADPTDYIKTNGAYDWNKYGKNSPTKDAAEKNKQYYVVPATSFTADGITYTGINNKVGDAANGMVVKLDGKDWMVTSLTLDNSGNVVASLWLSTGLCTTQQIPAAASPTKSNTAYSGGGYYNNLRTNEIWSLFRTSSAFAQKYLVQPKNIQYQRTQTINGRVSRAYVQPGDALCSLTSGWSSSLGWKYEPDDIITGTIRYDAWGEEYIWLPSLTETGADAFANNVCIWRTSSAQRNHSGITQYSALRSTDINVKKTTTRQIIGCDGTLSTTSSGTFDVRPAIHLNLTAAGMATGTALENPENISTTYNNASQSPKTAYTANNSAVSWYDATYYEHASNYVNLTYYNSENTQVSSIKDAGTYWVKAEITQAWLNAADTETTNEAPIYGWTAAQIEQAKPEQRPKFKGTADTSDSLHMESATVRWFKFTINKKEIEITTPSYNASTGQFTYPTVTNSSSLFADAPTVAIKFSGQAADGTNVNQINTVPTKRALSPYTAQAILVKSATDTSDYTAGNYVIKDENTKKCDVSIGYQKLTIPTVSNATQTYTGSDIKFPLSGYSTTATAPAVAWTDIADLVLPTGVTLEGDDTNGWNLVAKTAGEYTVTAKIKTAQSYDWCWNGTGGTEVVTDQTIKITVSRKTLYFDFTSTTGSFTMQQGATVTFGTDITTEIGTDDVKITLQYCNVDTPTVLIDIPTGSLDASTIANSGTYKLIASIDDTKAADNKNYALSTDTTLTTQEFIISSAGITLTSVDWQYRENAGAAVTVTGSGESNSNPFAVTYTGNAYVFSLKTSAADMHTAGVKIDTTYGTNGYSNSTQINATTSVVEITVRVIPYDETYAFYDSGHTLSANQYRDFTLYVKVDKASIDFTKLEWSGTELEYNGMNQTVTITSGLPSFLSVTYSDNVKWAIGDYTASISGLSVTDGEAAKNYVVPTNYSTIPTHAWSIVKKKIPVSWVDSEESVGDGHNVVFVPTFADNSTGAVEYVYYPKKDGVSAPDLDNPKTLAEVIGAYDGTNKKQYYVAAKLRDTSTGERDYTSANSVLIENDEEVSEAYKIFEVGADKNPVRVSLKTDKVTYNGKHQPAEVEIDSVGFDAENLRISYKIKNADGEFEPFDEVDGPPMYAGEYKVVVSVGMPQAETFAIAGQREFDYIIEKADLDFSDMKWLDSLNDDAEYTEAYTYFPGLSHKLEYVGTPKFNDKEIESGLTITFTDVTESNVGKYKVRVTFTTDEFFDTSWNIPEDFDFEWEILQYTPDLSNVKWNYNDEPFTFKIIGGIPVKYSARLIGFPEDYAAELAAIISYGNDTGEYSDIGTHTTSFSINTEHELYGNYGELVLPAGLETSIDWEIHPLKVEKAEQKQTKPFDVDGYTFEQITNLPEDFDEYFEVSVLDNLNQDVPQTAEGSWLFVSMGRYRIQIRFRNGMNKNSGGNFDNVKWSDNSRGAYQITLNIEKLVFVADGWINGEDVEKPTLDTDEEALNNIEKYFDYVLTRQDTGESVPLNAILDYETYYYISLKLKDEFAGNVAIKYAGKEVSETEPYLFRTGLDPFADEPENFYEKPTELTIEYRHTGEEITFEFGDWFDEEVMEAIGAMKGTDVGEYPVMVGFKPGSLAAWGTEDDYDVSAITVTFVIYEDDTYGKFILKETAKKNAFKFQYEDFSELEGDIKDYVYDTDNVVYMTKLTCEDTLADLLAQFKNEDIMVYDEAGTSITDMTATLATGMILRLEDGGTVLNQLTISVLGDVDGDGDITTVDKAQLNAYSLGTLDLAGAKLLAGDIDDDGDITTVDKAQLNAYTLGSFDIYENLILKTATAQALSVEAEEGEEAIEDNTVTLSETTVIEVETSEEVKVNSEEKRKNSEKEVPEVFVDTRRLRVSF